MKRFINLFLSCLIVLGVKSETIIHLSGSVPGQNNTGKSDITYVADGPVNITSTIQLGNTLRIKYKGGIGWFNYTGTGDVFNSGQGNNLYDSLWNFHFGATATRVFDGITKIFLDAAQTKWLTWNGLPSSAIYYGLYVDSFTISGPNLLYEGPFEASNTGHMYMVGFTANDGVVTNNGLGVSYKVRGMSMFGFEFKRWKVQGPSFYTAADVGIFFIDCGSGIISDIWRNGGYGYLERIVIMKLSGIPFAQDCGLYNSIDVNSTQYGSVDFRIEPTWLTSPQAQFVLSGGDFTYQNVTAGNKVESQGIKYVTNAVIAGALKDASGKIWTAHIKNNFAFNAEVASGNQNSSLFKNNTNGFTIIDSSNNIDLPPGVALPVGYLDGSYYPLTGSILDKQGIGGKPMKTGCPVCPLCPTKSVLKNVIYFSDGSTITTVPQ